MKLKNMTKMIKDPWLLIESLNAKGYLKMIPDRTYLDWKYRRAFKEKLNLEHPLSFNEKLQWLKLFDRNPKYTKLVDKYEVRKYISDKIGEEYLIPLFGVWNDVEEINWESLPNQFVLKCTHDSGGVVICKNKELLDIDQAKKELKNSLSKKYYYGGREWPYKNVKPRIICEKYMVDESLTELKDYKFFCFNGEPKVLYVASNRGKGTKFDFYDLNFKHLQVRQTYDNNPNIINKPISFNSMIALARILSTGIPHVRIDFYDVNGKIYFGEFTFYHEGGFQKFEPKEFDEQLGSWIDLPN